MQFYVAANDHLITSVCVILLSTPHCYCTATFLLVNTGKIGLFIIIIYIDNFHYRNGWIH